MLERRSALATAQPFRSAKLRIEEAPEFSLTQVSGEGKKFAAALGQVPEVVGFATEHKGRTVLRIGPRQFWVIGPAGDDVAHKLAGLAKVVPLSSSRTRILLEGAPARDVLAKGIAVDFHAGVFAPGHFAQTGVHHMPVTVHCVGDNAFHIYALRTYAQSVWHWLSDAAREFAD